MSLVTFSAISVLSPSVIKIESPLEIVMDKSKFLILPNARRLLTFKVTMVGLAVWIGPMGY